MGTKINRLIPTLVLVLLPMLVLRPMVVSFNNESTTLAPQVSNSIPSSARNFSPGHSILHHVAREASETNVLATSASSVKLPLRLDRRLVSAINPVVPSCRSFLILRI